MGRRIWYIVSSLEVGGPHPLIELANGMAERGFEVTVWSLLDEMALAPEFDDAVTVRTVGATSKVEIWKLGSFLRTARAQRPDIVHSYFFFDNMVARLLKLVVPETTVVCGVMSVRRGQARHRRMLEDALLDVPDYYVSNSKAGGEFIAERGVSEDRIEVVYNGRSAEEYGGPADSAYLYADLDLPESAFLVGIVSRLVETKGIDDLLAALARLRADGRDVHAVIVGDGPEWDSLEATAAELDLSEHVTFTGMRTDVPAILDILDAFVFPSYQEGMPGAVIEAMLAGLPIVSTPVDGCAELLTDGETGVFVPVGDPDAIVSAVGRLIDEPEYAAELGDAARAEARESFSTQQRLESFESFYERIVDDG